MKKAANNSKFANFILHIIGFAFCILPPAICTLMYFPLWKAGGYATCIAGGGALVLVICAIPIFKFLRRALSSASSFLMWLVCFLLFFFLSKIADEMTVISFSGFAGNLIGAVFFKLSERRGAAE